MLSSYFDLEIRKTLPRLPPACGQGIPLTVEARACLEKSYMHAPNDGVVPRKSRHGEESVSKKVELQERPKRE
jgi:hypothetical protein